MKRKIWELALELATENYWIKEFKPLNANKEVVRRERKVERTKARRDYAKIETVLPVAQEFED